MIYLSTPPNDARLPSIIEAGIGVMRTPIGGLRLELLAKVPCWAADNGCFSQGEGFDLSAFLTWLERMRPVRANCLFAVAPDVMGDAVATWERSKDVLPQLRGLGFKAALVAQNGMEHTRTEWDAFDVLFVGGDTPWKLSEPAYELVKEAKRRGKWCHMGRVNSRRRLLAAAISGYDSADGTHLSYRPDRYLAQLTGWLDELRLQQRFTA